MRTFESNNFQYIGACRSHHTLSCIFLGCKSGFGWGDGFSSSPTHCLSCLRKRPTSCPLFRRGKNDLLLYRLRRALEIDIRLCLLSSGRSYGTQAPSWYLYPRSSRCLSTVLWSTPSCSVNLRVVCHIEVDQSIVDFLIQQAFWHVVGLPA